MVLRHSSAALDPDVFSSFIHCHDAGRDIVVN